LANLIAVIKDDIPMVLWLTNIKTEALHGRIVAVNCCVGGFALMQPANPKWEWFYYPL